MTFIIIHIHLDAYVQLYYYEVHPRWDFKPIYELNYVPSP
jgi:hypothetical protein